MRSMVVFFSCRSLQATDEFYLQRLGMKLWHTQPGCHIYDSGYGYLGFVEKSQVRLPEYSCISLNCGSREEVDRMYQKLKEQPSVTVPRQHPVFDVYSFFLKDPDGYTVEFQKIAEGGSR